MTVPLTAIKHATLVGVGIGIYAAGITIIEYDRIGKLPNGTDTYGLVVGFTGVGVMLTGLALTLEG